MIITLFLKINYQTQILLQNLLKIHTGKTSRNISEEDMYRGRELSVALADHNITYSEEKELLELLLLNDSLRESILEFDNFETLSYSAAPELANIAVQEFTFITDENNTTDTDTETVEENEELTLSESFFEDHETKRQRRRRRRNFIRKCRTRRI